MRSPVRFENIHFRPDAREKLAALRVRAERSTYLTCNPCIEYLDLRANALVHPLAARSIETGESAEEILDRFMGGVHDRHEAGLPILPEHPPG